MDAAFSTRVSVLEHGPAVCLHDARGRPSPRFMCDADPNSCVKIPDVTSVAMQFMLLATFTGVSGNGDLPVALTGKGLQCSDGLQTYMRRSGNVIHSHGGAAEDFQGRYDRCVFGGESQEGSLVTCIMRCACVGCVTVSLLVRLNADPGVNSNKTLCEINLLLGAN